MRRAIFGSIVLLFLAIVYLLTRGNAVWRVRSHYPNSEFSLAGDRIRDISVSGAIGSLFRGIGLDYYGGGEPLGIIITDQEGPIDLEHFKGITIGDLRFVNCTLKDIRLVLGTYRPWTTFQNCDLSDVPESQMKYLDFNEEYRSHIVNGRRLDEDPPKSFVRPYGIYAFYP